MKIYRFTNIGNLREEIFRSPLEQYILVALSDREISLDPHAIRRMRQVAEDTDVSLVYAWFREVNSDGSMLDHPLIQYSPGWRMVCSATQDESGPFLPDDSGIPIFRQPNGLPQKR